MGVAPCVMEPAWTPACKAGELTPSGRILMARLCFGLVVLLALVGCPQQEAATPGSSKTAGTAAPTEADHQEARDIFAGRCTPCHGEQGKGDGAASAGLDPKPRNFTLAEWQDSVTDEHIEKIIKYGGAAVQKSAAMPGNPDLSSKPAVIAALRLFVRGLRDK